MENRKHKRESVDQVARIVDSGRVVCSARVLNVSRGGLAIVNPGKQFKRGELIDLDVYRSGHPRGINYCVHAMVVHSGSEVMGLCYLNESFDI